MIEAKSSRPNIANLLLLSLAITGSIYLWCDRQTQPKDISADLTVESTTKSASLF